MAENCQINDVFLTKMGDNESCDAYLLLNFQWIKMIFFNFGINKIEFDKQISDWVIVKIIVSENWQYFFKVAGGTEDTQLDARPCCRHVTDKKSIQNVWPSYFILSISEHVPICGMCSKKFKTNSWIRILVFVGLWSEILTMNQL